MEVRNSKSLAILLFCYGLLLATGMWYYPKWQQSYTEAAISWDVSGYYMYLPAIFIYQDVKQLAFIDDVIAQYGPTPDPQQRFEHASGNYVLKYSSGMAIQYLPFFLAAHWYAKGHDSFPADGFSRPYQFAINLGSILVAWAGLWFLRLILLRYFEDLVAGVVLLTIAAATNYLDYSAINGAMSHNYLFTLYALLVFTTIRYHENPRTMRALGIGLILGLMVLTRPTEMLAGIIPVLWGVNGKGAWRERRHFIRTHWRHIAWLGAGVIAVGSIQIIYWLYVTGSPLVYSYEEQGFRFFKPHLINGIFSYRSGWLMYSPAMAASLVGFYFLWKKRSTVLLAAGIFTVLFIWITFSWNAWTYGGALGQRAMVQSYVVLAFPLGAFVRWVLQQKAWLRVGGVALLAWCIWYNLWLTHHAHKGGLLRPGEMTKAYFWEIFGKREAPETSQFFLDTKEMYRDIPVKADTLFTDSFDHADNPACALPSFGNTGTLCIPPGDQSVELAALDLRATPHDWLRATADFQIEHREWTTWRMGMFTIELFHNDEKVISRHLRPLRILDHKEKKRISVDMRLPSREFDQVKVAYISYGATVPVLIDNLVVVAFNEK